MVEATPVRALPLAEVVYMLLHARIARGDYGTADRLPSETELARQFGVSRPVLRTAIQRLKEEGLVRSRQGAGNFVDTASTTVGQFPNVETIADIQRCYEFRMVLETEAAGLAAMRRDNAAIGRMRDAFSLLSGGINAIAMAQDADFAFHSAIARGTRNAYFIQSLEALRSHIYVGMKLRGDSLKPNRALAPEQVLEEHRAILTAIEAGEAKTASAAMRAHITHSQARLFGATLLDLSASD